MTAPVLVHAALLAAAKREVIAALRKYTDLLHGDLLWDEPEAYPEYVHSPDPQQDAVEQAFAELEEARSHLAGLQEQTETQAPTGSGK